MKLVWNNLTITGFITLEHAFLKKRICVIKFTSASFLVIL